MVVLELLHWTQTTQTHCHESLNSLYISAHIASAVEGEIMPRPASGVCHLNSSNQAAGGSSPQCSRIPKHIPARNTSPKVH